MTVEIKDKENDVLITLQANDLRYADLRYAPLRYADLCYADLCYADLCYADLCYANLRHADLRYAYLRYADLRYADLRNADLRGADLRGAILPETDIIISNKYHIHIRPDYIKIGCENHSPSWWKKLSFKKAGFLDTGAGAGEWWKQWKPVVLAIYETIKDR